jgi:hypothetical protein
MTLIALAKQHGCPLITHDGMGHNGPTAKKTSIRAKALAAGVEALTSEEFSLRHPVTRQQTNQFLGDFVRFGVAFFGSLKRPDATQQHEAMFNYLRDILGGTDPVAVAEREERFGRPPKA